MQSRNNSTKAFLELVRAGLWEKEARLLPFNKVDYNEVIHLAEKQSVDGLVAAGFNHVVDKKVPQEVVLTFIGSALQVEQRNIAMTNFIGIIVEKLRKSGIRALLGSKDNSCNLRGDCGCYSIIPSRRWLGIMVTA